MGQCTSNNILRAQRELSKLPFVLSFVEQQLPTGQAFGQGAFVCGTANTPANAFIAQVFPCEHHGTTAGRRVLLPVRRVSIHC
jgi:hypothetical protein